MSLLEKRTFTEGQRKTKAASQGGSQRNKYAEPTLLPLLHQLLGLLVNQTPPEASGLGDPDTAVRRGQCSEETVLGEQWSGLEEHHMRVVKTPACLFPNSMLPTFLRGWSQGLLCQPENTAAPTPFDLSYVFAFQMKYA